MHVYRIEWPDGTGFYRSNYFDHGLIDHTNEDWTHPTPFNDSAWCASYNTLVYKRPHLDWADLRFAFESLRSLRRWFYNDQWIVNISEAGGVLCTYEVDPNTTVVGRTQLAFDYSTAKLITKEPLANILEKV